MEELLPRMLNDILSHEMVQDTQILIRIPRGMSNSINQCIIGLHKWLIVTTCFNLYHILQFFFKVHGNFFVEKCAYICDIHQDFFFKHYTFFYKSAFHQICCPKELKNYKLHFDVWNLVKISNCIIFSWNRGMGHFHVVTYNYLSK